MILIDGLQCKKQGTSKEYEIDTLNIKLTTIETITLNNTMQSHTLTIS